MIIVNPERAKTAEPAPKVRKAAKSRQAQAQSSQSPQARRAIFNEPGPAFYDQNGNERPRESSLEKGAGRRASFHDLMTGPANRADGSVHRQPPESFFLPR